MEISRSNCPKKLLAGLGGKDTETPDADAPKVMLFAPDAIEKDGRYYLFVDSLTIDADPNVGIDSDADEHLDIFHLDKEIVSVRWLDDGTDVAFSQKDGVVRVKPNAFEYGRNLVVRVAEITVK